MDNIVFYDGECGFCNKSVQFILKNRKSNNLKFLPLQSKKSESILENFNVQIDMSTLYFLQNGSLTEKSSAVLKITNRLKWYWFWLKIGYILPKGWRNRIYDKVANNRYKITGSFCYIPDKEERKMFPELQ